MSIITKIDRHNSITETTLNGVVDSIATYEIVDGVLIIRTSSHGTIHITREIGIELTKIIINELL